MNFLRRLFTRQPPRVIDVSRFGPRRTWREVQDTMKAIHGSTHYEVLGQLLTIQRARCLEAVEMKSNLQHNQTAFEAGAASALADMLDIFMELAQARCKDTELASWFAQPAKEKQGD